MDVAIVTLDGFNEIDTFVALNILNRVELPDWKAWVVGPGETIVSRNGVVVHPQQPLSFVRQADAVLFGSGRRTLELIEDASLMAQLVVDPSRQLIALRRARRVGGRVHPRRAVDGRGGGDVDGDTCRPHV